MSVSSRQGVIWRLVPAERVCSEAPRGVVIPDVEAAAPQITIRFVDSLELTRAGRSCRRIRG
jgi:hypothetical protein